MRARRGTSGGWSRRRRRCGVRTITAGGARQCGLRASIWRSTGGDRLSRAGTVARVLRGAGVVSGAVRALRSRRAGGHDAAAAGGLRGRRPAVEGHRGAPGRLREVSDLVVPGIDGAGGPFGGLVAANVAAAASCTQVNAARHSEICGVPVERQLVRRPGHEHLRVLSAALRVEPGQVRVPTRQRGRFSWPRLPSAWRMLRTALQLIHRIRTFAPRLAPRSSIRSPGTCAFGHSPP